MLRPRSSTPQKRPQTTFSTTKTPDLFPGRVSGPPGAMAVPLGNGQHNASAGNIYAQANGQPQPAYGQIPPQHSVPNMRPFHPQHPGTTSHPTLSHQTPSCGSHYEDAVPRSCTSYTSDRGSWPAAALTHLTHFLRPSRLSEQTGVLIAPEDRLVTSVTLSTSPLTLLSRRLRAQRTSAAVRGRGGDVRDSQVQQRPHERLHSHQRTSATRLPGLLRILLSLLRRASPHLLLRRRRQRTQAAPTPRLQSPAAATRTPTRARQANPHRHHCATAPRTPTTTARSTRTRKAQRSVFPGQDHSACPAPLAAKVFAAIPKSAEALVCDCVLVGEGALVLAKRTRGPRRNPPRPLLSFRFAAGLRFPSLPPSACTVCAPLSPNCRREEEGAIDQGEWCVSMCMTRPLWTSMSRREWHKCRVSVFFSFLSSPRELYSFHIPAAASIIEIAALTHSYA